MPADLSPTTFEPHVGSEFTIDLDEANRVVLTLAIVERAPTRAHGERTEPFSLIFVAPAGSVLGQGTHALGHDVLGQLDIFVVPIGPDSSGSPRFEAVFN